MKAELNLIVVWSLGDIQGFSVVVGLKPQVKVDAPLVTFNYPDKVRVNEAIPLTLHIQNQDDHQIQIEIDVKETEVMWVGKTKFVLSLEAQ